MDRSNGLSRGSDLTILGVSFSICVPLCINLVSGRIRLKMSKCIRGNGLPMRRLVYHNGNGSVDGP
eukprot:scaffold124710_cov35-Cyclotella_meneghiniana.AAC.1